MAACSFSFWTLVLARLIQGISSAAIVTTSISLITHHFDLPQRSHVLAKWVFSVGLGLAFGPLVGGIVVNLINWRFIFLINLPIGLMSYWMIKTTIVESKSEVNLKALDIINSFLLFLTVLFLSIFLAEGSVLGWTSIYSLLLISGCLTMLSGFIYLVAKNKNAFIYLDFCKNRSFITGMISGFFSYFFMYAWLFLFSLYLQEARGATPLLASIICLPFSIAFAFSPKLISKYLANIDESNFEKLVYLNNKINSSNFTVVAHILGRMS